MICAVICHAPVNKRRVEEASDRRPPGTKKIASAFRLCIRCQNARRPPGVSRSFISGVARCQRRDGHGSDVAAKAPFVCSAGGQLNRSGDVRRPTAQSGR